MAIISDVNDDTELISMVREGSHHAFTVLVKRYTKLYYNIAYRYLSNKVEAEDVVQSAFLKLWEYPYKFDIDKNVPFKTWFTRVIINMSIDILRGKQPSIDIENIAITDYSYQNADDMLDDKNKKIKLEKAIRKLPERQKTAINLGIYEQLPYSEVAIIMKTNLKSVQSLIMRAKDNLKKAIGGKDD